MAENALGRFARLLTGVVLTQGHLGLARSTPPEPPSASPPPYEARVTPPTKRGGRS